MSNLTDLLQDYGLSNDTLPVSADGRVWSWYNVPNVRGTWDILWTCLATIFLCTYSLLSLNLPAPKDSKTHQIRRRILWMIIAIMGPEIVLTYAAGQWSRASHSVKAFRGAGFKKWTMKMAFFSDMGGFVLQCPNQPAFPLNAKQLHWLVMEGHLDYPTVSEDEIRDKSKQDFLSKTVTSFQAGYVVLNSIARGIQGLGITTLELNTLAIVVCSLMTVAAWYHKPCDVIVPIVLQCQHSLEQITDNRAWKTTPLDFVDENGPGWSMNIQPFMHMPTIPAERPISRIPNDRFPTNPYGSQEYFVCVATLLFTGIHLVGWRFQFPTATELLLWRISSSILFGVTALFWILETAASWVRLG